MADPQKLELILRELGSVRSERHPQSGQKNRSSGNFNIQNADDAFCLLWVIENQTANDNPGSISFKVMIDNSGAKDGDLLGGRRIGHCDLINTRDSTIWSRSLYIANPSGATDPFLVKVYGGFKA